MPGKKKKCQSTLSFLKLATGPVICALADLSITVPLPKMRCGKEKRRWGELKARLKANPFETRRSESVLCEGSKTDTRLDSGIELADQLRSRSSGGFAKIQ